MAEIHISIKTEDSSAVLGKYLFEGTLDSFEIVSGRGGVYSLNLNEDYSLKQHYKSIRSRHGEGTGIQTVEAAPASLPTEIPKFIIAAVDLDKLELLGKRVWDNVFRKPSPVPDRTVWAKTEESDNYVYLPNLSRLKGNEAEDFNSNSLYNEVLIQAYVNMCAKENINPSIQLVNGQELLIGYLQPYNAVQNSVPAERVARLCNSKLIDFDDSKYGRSFIQEICDLDDVTSEPARQKVLSKVEFILAGKSSRIYNQRFIRNFFHLVTGQYLEKMTEWFGESVSDALSNLTQILRVMAADGMILESSGEEFRDNLSAAGMAGLATELVNIYEQAKKLN